MSEAKTLIEPQREFHGPSPSIVCLCPSYGRPALVQNALALFLDQTYPKSRANLLICDDADQIRCQRGENWEVVSLQNRFPSLPEKYNWMVEYARIHYYEPDVFAIWEDDDLYLPWHLRNSVEGLLDHWWTKPKMVWSNYGGILQQEVATGRFHASICVRNSYLERVGGWIETKDADFDQQFIARLQHQATPGDPTAHAAPSYFFRWQGTGFPHGQGFMKGPKDQTWYESYAKNVGARFEQVETLVPFYDESSMRLIKEVLKVLEKE